MLDAISSVYNVRYYLHEQVRNNNLTGHDKSPSSSLPSWYLVSFLLSNAFMYQLIAIPNVTGDLWIDLKI